MDRRTKVPSLQRLLLCLNPSLPARHRALPKQEHASLARLGNIASDHKPARQTGDLAPLHKSPNPSFQGVLVCSSVLSPCEPSVGSPLYCLSGAGLPSASPRAGERERPSYIGCLPFSRP